jgi:hypothetical protein
MAMCVFGEPDLRCARCGYRAKRIPTYRECRTILEMARSASRKSSTERIAVPPLRIGDAVAAGLSAIGVTPARIKRVTGMKECGCEARKRAMNAAGAAISRAIEAPVNAALNFILPHQVEDREVAEIANAIAASPLTNQGLKDKAAGRPTPPPDPPPPVN